MEAQEDPHPEREVKGGASSHKGEEGEALWGWQVRGCGWAPPFKSYPLPTPTSTPLPKALLPAHPGLAHLPLGLLQPWPKLPLLPLEGGAAPLQLLTFLQQLCKVILQLPLLLLQLEHLKLQQLLGPLRPLCLGRAVLSQGLALALPVPLPFLVHLRARGQAWVLVAPPNLKPWPPAAPQSPTALAPVLGSGKVDSIQ